ncbi:hypothetical protein KAT24_02370 [Candidatus Pacearchaeota archaeon]|nr:hypothetical protein [Candidatus Pacearchaeota archaeon]
MGAIRGVLLVFVCVVLFLSLFVGNILLTFSSSLRYENAKPEFVSFLGDVINEQLNIEEQLTQLLPVIELYCQTNQQYSFGYGEHTFTIPCDIAEQGSGALVEYGVTSLVDKYYYAEYNCDFLDCFGEEEVPLFLISEKAQGYWQSKFYFVLLLSVALAVLVFFLVEKKTNFFLLVGALTIISALPLMWMNKVGSIFSGSAGEMNQYIPQVMNIFFNQSHSVFIKVLIIGGVLVIAGIILKIFHIGFAISNFFEKIKSKKKIEKVKSNKEVKQVKSNKQLITDSKKEKKNKKSK